MSFEDPTADELRLLTVLVDMSEQYLGAGLASLDHGCMSTGEHAVHLLDKYGLVVKDGRGGAWTSKSEVLARLKDDLSNADQIRAELRQTPAGELRSFPQGVRAHRPDVVLDSLRIWAVNRAMARRIRPSRFPQPGPDRLYVEARLGLGSGEAVLCGDLVTTGELRVFRNQLAGMLDGSVQQAHLVAFKESLKITLTVDADQNYAGTITIRNPIDKYVATAEINSRSVYPDRTVRGLDEVLARFP